MPTYVYECSSCARQMEVIRKISDPEEKPACDNPGCNMHAVEMNRVITPVGFVLKGKCWARDGYK